MRAAPSPANISTNDDALCAKKRAPVSCATAFAASVLPVPGGPWNRTPFGTRAPSASNRCGSRRKSTISCSSSFASSSPATSSQVTDDSEPGRDLGRLDARHQLDRLPEQVDDRAHQEEEQDRQPRQREVGHEVAEPAGGDHHVSCRQRPGTASSEATASSRDANATPASRHAASAGRGARLVEPARRLLDEHDRLPARDADRGSPRRRRRRSRHRRARPRRERAARAGGRHSGS